MINIDQENKNNSIELTKQLLQIPSESGGEKAIGEFIIEQLKNDFEITKQIVGNRFNILATKGIPNLLLATHIDTVPKQLEIKEDNEFLYGRGACDTKGIIASMICASKQAVKENLTNFALMFDVSEETDFSGVKEAINLVNPKTTIIGEPTKLKLVTGQKGILEIKISCAGKSCHSSMPENGISAIENLIELLQKVRSMQLPKENKLGKTTMNIGKISGGIAANIVPDYAEAIISFRTNTKNEELINEIKKIIPKENLEIKNSFEPALTEDETVLEKFSLQKETVPYFTEMYFWAKKSNTFIFGPGSIEDAHSNTEKISKQEIIQATKQYLEFIKLFM